MEVNIKDINVNCEKLKLTGKKLKVKEELELSTSKNISADEYQLRTALLEHLQGTSLGRDKPRHFHQRHKYTDIPKKEGGDNFKHENSLKCVNHISQEDVASTRHTKDICETSQNTIKENKPTKADDYKERNRCRKSNKSKKDIDSSQTLDFTGNKRPLEAVEECAKKRRKEPAGGLGSTEHESKERIKDDESLEDGEIRDDNEVEESDSEIEPHKTGETKIPESISKEFALREVKRYSKVVLVGDARMTLLATSDIKEQLHEVTQVIVVPNLTLNGILEVVQREVVKEECPRGILLLCLAGLHGTLVECEVPKECRTAGHSDMHEMVPATKSNSLDPGFPKQLASLKRKLQDALGRGSSVLFFPVLPVDMTKFNEIAAKHHFDATGHKLEHLSQAGSLHYQLLQQYKKAVEEVNGSSVTYVRLVRFEFGSRRSCKKFTDELLQDGFSPTRDLVEQSIVPQLQHSIEMSNSLRFQQVVLVGDACLAQVVKKQQQKGVEPCSFILQEESGLRSLTPDSPAVKQLTGMCNALIFLSVILKDLKGESEEKTHCFLPHDPSQAFDNFLQEALRVDQMLCSLTHHCTIITTPVTPLIHQTLTKDKARKTSCDKCTETAKLVTVAIKQVSKMLNQKNGLPVWNLYRALQKNTDVPSSSHQSPSLTSKMVQKAASTWECFLNCSQACIRVMPRVTITSVLQDYKLLSALLPKARETIRTHCNKEETQSSQSRDEQIHNSSSRNKEQIHNDSSIDRAQTQRSCSIDRKQKSVSACSALSYNTSNTFSPIQEEHIINDVSNLLSIKSFNDQYYTYVESSPPSSPDLSSPNNIMDSSHVEPSQITQEEQNIGSLSLISSDLQDVIGSSYTGPFQTRYKEQNIETLSQDLPKLQDFMDTSYSGPLQTRYDKEQTIESLSLIPPKLKGFMNSSHSGFFKTSHSKENTEPLNVISPEFQKHFNTDLTSLSSHERPTDMDSKDNLSSPQKLFHAQQVTPSISSSEMGSHPSSENMEISSCTHSSLDSCGGQDRNRERKRNSITENTKARNQSTRKSHDTSRGRSFSPKEKHSGRNPRMTSHAKLCLSHKRKPTYRQSHSRSLSPTHWYKYGSISEDKKSISGDRKSTSRDVRSASRSRSVSRNKRSISTSRCNSKGRRLISRSRSVSRDRSMSWGRSISKDKISLPRNKSVLRGRRSISRKRSVSRSRIPILRNKRSFSKSRSTSRCGRSISRGKRSSSKSERSVYRGRRSTSRRRSVHKSKRSVFRSRSISRGKKIISRSRSISRSETSISRDKRSSSRSRKSISRDRQYPSRDKRSISRTRKSFSVKRSIPRGKKSFSKSRKSISRGRRSLSSNESVSRFILRDKRSLSSSRSVVKGKTSRRSISRSRRSISKSRRSLSRSRRSTSRSRRSISRSRSLSRRRFVSKYKRSLSRSRPFSRGRRSTSRERIPISRCLRSKSRSRRSISRGKKSVLRDGKSRSNVKVEHNSVKLPVHTPSAKHKNTKENIVKEALENLRSIHENECKMYRSNPSIHPDIGVEYRLFCEKKTQSILALGGDPTQYNMAYDWHSFWKKRMEEIFIESWQLKRKQCLELLDASQKARSRQPSSRTHRSYSISSSSSSSSFFTLFSSSSSSISSSSFSSSSLVQQKKTSKKTWKNRFSQSSKRMKKKLETETQSTEANPRGRKVKTSSVSQRHEERHSADYSRSTLSDTESFEEDWDVAGMPRGTKKKKLVKKLPYSSPCVIQPRSKGQNQSTGEFCKKVNMNPPSPPEISTMNQQELYDEHKQWLIERLLNSFPCQSSEKNCEKINRNLPNPPQISEMNQQNLDGKHKEWVIERLPNSSSCVVQLSREELSQNTKKSCKKINREPPSPPHISRMSQQKLDDKQKHGFIESPCMVQPGRDGLSQNTEKSCKKIKREPPSPPHISKINQQELNDKQKHWFIERPSVVQPNRDGQSQNTDKSCKQINREPPSPPHISRMSQQGLDNKQKHGFIESPCAVQPSKIGQSQNTEKSSKKIYREPPSPPQITKITQQKLDDKHKQWLLSSPPNQSTICGESQQYIFKPNNFEHISIDKQSLTSTTIIEGAKLEQLEQHKVKSSISVLDHLLHLSSQECITMSSKRPEIAVSEAQEKQDSGIHSDSNMGKENRKKTFTNQSDWYKSTKWQKKDALFSQGDQSYQSIQVTNNATSSQVKKLHIHYSGNYTESEPGKSHNIPTADQNSSETITHIKNFAPNTLTKPSTVESTTQDHEDKVSLTTTSKSIKIDVIDVLQILLLIEDQIGVVCAPLKQILVVAKELQSSGTNPLIILNDKDNKLLLQIIQKKLQSLLRDSKLSNIKKVIVEEAKQRLAVLLEHQEPHELLDGLNVKQLASHCLNMDVTATLTYICEVLQTQGRTHVPQEQLVNLYKCVEEEKLALKGSCWNNKASTATNWTESSCLQLLGNTMDSHASVLKVAFVGHEEIPTHFALDGCEIRIYRAPGGTAKNFLSDPRMNKILQWAHDLTILFLGSNDIHQECEPVFITDKITQVANLITRTCNSKIAITLIEPWKNRNSNWVSEEFYNMVSKNINEKLEINMKEQFFINLSTKLFSADMQKHGKHWNDEWRIFKDHEFRYIIVKFKQLHEVIQSVIGFGEKS